MNIRKFGHCCLLIEEKGVRILTDPGTFTSEQDNIKGIDIILITHEHQDHFHVPSVKAMLRNNPHAEVVTNHSVGKLLEKEHLPFRVVGDGERATIKGIVIEGIGTAHAIIHPELPGVENTGYFLAGKLFYPGDAFTVPEKYTDVLALPTAGPWMKVSEAIDYARAVKPRICFPVHDAVVVEGMHSLMTRLAQTLLAPRGIAYHPLGAGESFDTDKV